MVKRLRVPVVIVVAALLIQDGYCTTNCKQKFTFIARTMGANPVFWIGEDLSGQCEQSQLLQVAIVEGRAVLIKSDLRLQDDWLWLVEAMEKFRNEQPVELVEDEGIWKTKGVQWFVTTPDPNGELISAFSKHIIEGGDNGVSWNKKMERRGVVPPVVSGFDTEMVYYYDRGLYVNYEIAKVYYFPKSGYLLVFTAQKRLAVGNDTMHGFILLRRI